MAYSPPAGLHRRLSHILHFPDCDDESYIQGAQEEIDFIPAQLECDLVCILHVRIILDGGCAIVRPGPDLASRGHTVTVIDRSESPLHQAQGRAEADGLMCPG